MKTLSKTPFNSANDSPLFLDLQRIQESGLRLGRFHDVTLDGDRWLPIYEPKLIHQFNHRFATFRFDGVDGRAETFSATFLESPESYVFPRYWLSQATLQERFPGSWFVVVRNITGALNERTAIAAIIPQRPCVDANLILEVSPTEALLLCSNMNSFPYDYLARQKIAGVHFNQFMWRQLPLLAPARVGDWCLKIHAAGDGWLNARVLELTFTAWDLEPFAKDCGYDGPPFRWDEERRFLIRCELDAAYFHLYGIARDDVDYILETFPIVKRKDIQRHGDYRTKLTILRIYDALADAIATGRPYQTLLTPPPGLPSTGLPHWQPGQPKPVSWPVHIHSPREVSDVRQKESPS